MLLSFPQWSVHRIKMQSSSAEYGSGPCFSEPRASGSGAFPGGSRGGARGGSTDFEKRLEKTSRRGLNDPRETSEASRTPSPPLPGAPTRDPRGPASQPKGRPVPASPRGIRDKHPPAPWGLTAPSARLGSWELKAERRGRDPGTQVSALPGGFGVDA